MYKIIEIFDKLKYFIPPVIVIIFHRLKHYKSLKVPVPYSNIYYNKEDLPEIQNDAWSSEGWISGVEKDNAPAHPTNSHHFTTIILANEIFLKYGKFYIFDFGGGITNMSKMLPYDKVDMSYVVLDSESTCLIGKKKNKEAIFYSDIKKAYSSFSHSNGIVVANSSFHYCINWEEIISLFVEVSPRYIIIGRFPTAINQSKPIYSVQTVHGCGQAHVVLIPIDTLVKEMNKYNYTLHSNLPLNDASNYFDKEKRQKVGIIKNITLVFKRN